MNFVPGNYVYPGGAVDAQDADPDAFGLCAGLDDARASALLGVASGGLAYWVAAIRESFEEAGLLRRAVAAQWVAQRVADQLHGFPGPGYYLRPSY